MVIPNTPVHLDRGAPTARGAFGVEARLRALTRHLPPAKGRWLDVGCGNGSYTAEICQSADMVIGIDLSLAYLKEARTLLYARHDRAGLVRGMGEQLPFGDRAFDVVSLIEVLEHVDSEQRTLAECGRVLRRGGALAMTVPNKLYPFETHGAYVGGRFIGGRVPFISWLPEPVHRRLARARIYTPRRIRALLSETGFTVAALGFVFPPLDRLRLWTPAKRAYRALASVLERTPLARFGVSIVVVARKQ